MKKSTKQPYSVFILLSCSYEDRTPIAVFDSLEDAQNWIKNSKWENYNNNPFEWWGNSYDKKGLPKGSYSIVSSEYYSSR